jgi:hypothetical protein
MERISQQSLINLVTSIENTNQRDEMAKIPKSDQSRNTSRNYKSEK